MDGIAIVSQAYKIRVAEGETTAEATLHCHTDGIRLSDIVSNNQKLTLRLQFFVIELARLFYSELPLHVTTPLGKELDLAIDEAGFERERGGTAIIPAPSQPKSSDAVEGIRITYESTINTAVNEWLGIREDNEEDDEGEVFVTVEGEEE